MVRTPMRTLRCLVGLSVAACSGGPTVTVDARIDAPAYFAENIDLVGHVDLDEDYSIGLAVAGNHAYVGHKLAGTVDIFDISNPAAPMRVGELVAGFEATELRATADPPRLYVLVAPTELVIYDLANPVVPQRIGGVAVPNTIGHEFFLWRDPSSPSRVLAVLSDVSTNGGFAVLDVSDPSAASVHYRQTSSPLHSASLSDDGTRMYLSYISGDVAILDSTQLVAQGIAQAAPQLGRRRISECVAQSPTCIAHSTVRVPGRALAVVTSENEKCPKGGMDLVDLTDEAMPTRVGSWSHANAGDCSPDPGNGLFGYGAHNPTTTASLALVSWYRAGFLVFDVTTPSAPVNVAHFFVNAPAGSQFAWGYIASVSYPIIKDGLIYVLDGRNGLDILRYVGPHRDEIDGVDFLEGNSNL